MSNNVQLLMIQCRVGIDVYFTHYSCKTYLYLTRKSPPAAAEALAMAVT